MWSLVVWFVWVGWFSTAFSRGPGFFVLFGSFCGGALVGGAGALSSAVRARVRARR